MNSARLGDFDSATQLDGTGMISSDVGTLWYAAPEVLAWKANNLENKFFGKPADVYSFGAFCHELLEGQLYPQLHLAPGLPHSLSKADFIASVTSLENPLRPQINETLKIDEGDDVLRELRSIIRGCLHSDPNCRPSFQDINEKLKDLTATRSDRNVVKNGKSSSCIVQDGGCYFLQGRRRSMEDFCFSSASYEVCGVFDGHGGSGVARFAANRLRSLSSIPGTKAVEMVHSIDQYICKKLDAIAIGCGSTATIITIDEAFIHAAWLGDSGAVLFKQDGSFISLTTHYHRPGESSEKKRIESSGGIVKRMEREMDDGNLYPYGPFRIWSTDNRRGLAVSRSLGNLDLRPFVAGDPDAFSHTRDSSDFFCILATDGLWDILFEEHVFDIVSNAFKSGKTAQEISALLVNTAFEEGSQDNISA